MKIITTAPVRISMCNSGDTDYYIKELGWSNIINATIANMGYRCTLVPKKQKGITYTYSNTFMKKRETYAIDDMNNIQKNTEIITETIKHMNPHFTGDITITTNVPERSGLGGSSALMVTLIKALAKTQQVKKMIPEEIARTAYAIERKKMKINGGYQDQWAAAFGGGVNYLEFSKGGVFLEPLWLHEKGMRKLESHLALFFTEPRNGTSGDMHNELEKQLKKSKEETKEIMIKKRMNVSKTREAILRGDIKNLAGLLKKEQEYKIQLSSKVNTAKTDEIYNTALKYGALAGKVSGAGNGGCAFFILDKKKDKKKFIKKMCDHGCIHLPIKLQRLNHMGT